MPYKLDWEPSGVVFRFSGVVSDEDLLASNEDVYAHSSFSTLKYELVDFSAIGKADVSSETVRTVADLDLAAAKINPHVKVAIIVNTDFGRGMSSMYALSQESTGGTWRTEIFDNEEDARAWLMENSDAS